MWRKFQDFSATLILSEINFGWFLKVKNCHFNNFGGFEFWFLEKLHTWKCQMLPKIQNSELLKWVKWQFLGLQNDPNWPQNVSGRNNLKFQHCVFPIRLPRSVPIFAEIKTIFDFQYGVARTNVGIFEP